MDVDNIRLGVNFVEVLRNEVASCGVLLAVIGRNWLDARDNEGNRRLENPDDFVRVEISAALQRDIPVIPILVDGARIPSADRLPDDLKELALRNALEVRHASFKDDVDKLIRELKRAVMRRDRHLLLSLFALVAREWQAMRDSGDLRRLLRFEQARELRVAISDRTPLAAKITIVMLGPAFIIVFLLYLIKYTAVSLTVSATVLIVGALISNAIKKRLKVKENSNP
jgi:hypothetical protein